MAKRSAESIIKGYFYQFDNSILELLKLSENTNSITIEGIEDIDIHTANESTAIQCKYYEGSEYNHSIISKPIRLMLDHFAEYKKGNTQKIKYILRGHYQSGQEKLSLPIDIDFLKTKLLTYKKDVITYEHHTSLGLSDDDLNEFIELLQIDINAKSYDDQFTELMTALKSAFDCETHLTEHFYYNNALSKIKDLSILSDVNLRTISRNSFIESINTKDALFNEWFAKLKSRKEYIKEINLRLKSKGALEPSREKIIIIGGNILEAEELELPVEIFIENLILKFFKLKTAFRDAKPLTLILDCDLERVKRIKIHLIDKNLFFNDGYEDLKFSTESFNTPPIVNLTANGSKITKASYVIKILSKSTFETHFENIKEPTVFINFSKNNTQNHFESGQFFDIKYCDSCNDLLQILTK